MLVESIVCKCLERREGETGAEDDEGERRREREEASPEWCEGLEGLLGRLEGANRIVINVKWRREQGTENGGAS